MDMLHNEWLDIDEKVAAKTATEIRAEIMWHLKTLCDLLRVYKGDDAAFAISVVNVIVGDLLG